MEVQWTPDAQLDTDSGPVSEASLVSDVALMPDAMLDVALMPDAMLDVALMPDAMLDVALMPDAMLDAEGAALGPDSDVTLAADADALISVDASPTSDSVSSLSDTDGKSLSASLC